MNATRAAAVQAVAFLMVVFVGFAYVLAHFATGGVETLGVASWPQISDGRFTKAIDRAVVAALPKSERLDGLQAGLEYRIFADAGPQVRAGCPGWLFLSQELVDVPDGDRNLQLHRELAGRIAAQLATRGIAVVMLPVPDKARIAAAQLCGRPVAPQARRRLADWQRAASGLDAAQVDVVTGWPGKPGYWRTDTHWDRVGANYAAVRTAAVVDRLLRSRGSERATVTRSPRLVARTGDLMHLADLDRAPPALRPPSDLERRSNVQWQPAGGLLDAGPAPTVLLAGSSYSKNSGFANDLGLALGREVVQLSQDGGGFDGAILALLETRPALLAQAKVVVWEWPERALTQPLTDAERSFLSVSAR
ncbi:MAG: alginate O-acetyltransferase AlgX-related protein [Vulcanimicrobiaceae bacterium]